MKTILYKRNGKNEPIVWQISKVDEDNSSTLFISHGTIGKKLIKETIDITLQKVDEYESRIKAKRKQGYKELNEIKDSLDDKWVKVIENQVWNYNHNPSELIHILDTYLPKNNTSSDGFVLPMLAKTLEDNKPFEKYGSFFGQYKIDGLRCLIGAIKTIDMFNPIKLIYHSRTGEDWTNKLNWMDNIILSKLNSNTIDLLVEEEAYLDGELYIPGYHINDINSFVKNTSLEQHYHLQYWWYDICCDYRNVVERNKIRESNNVFIIRPTSKDSHLNNTNQFVTLPSFEIPNITDAIAFRNKFIDFGFEGLIIRNPNNDYQFGKRNQSMFKFKKIDDGCFEILDIKEDKRGLPIYVLKNDINDELFECTINLPQDKQRFHLDIKNNLVGKKALVEFRARSGIKQVPFHAKVIKIYI